MRRHFCLRSDSRLTRSRGSGQRDQSGGSTGASHPLSHKSACYREFTREAAREWQF